MMFTRVYMQASVFIAKGRRTFVGSRVSPTYRVDDHSIAVRCVHLPFVFAMCYVSRFVYPATGLNEPSYRFPT